MIKDMFPQSLSGSICLDKIDSKYIFEFNGKRYLNLRLKFTPDSQFGNDYMISQDVDKETRDACKQSGEWPKTPILGNLKVWDSSRSTAQPQQSNTPHSTTTAVPSAAPNDEGLPF